MPKTLRTAPLAFATALLAASAASCGHHRDHVASPCPDGASWDGASCVPVGQSPQPQEEAPSGPGALGDPNASDFTCPGGSVVQGNGCACPNGLVWIAEQCQVPPSEPVAVAAPQPRRRSPSPFIPAPPQPPAPPPMPQLTGPTINLTPPSDPSTPTRSPPRQSPPSSPPSPRGSSGSPPPTVTYPECKNGMVRVGIACQCPTGTVWENDACRVRCEPTQRREGNTCVCPKDTRWNGSACEPWQECRPGQVRFRGFCLCPADTKWDGRRCAATAPAAAGKPDAGAPRK